MTTGFSIDPTVLRTVSYNRIVKALIIKLNQNQNKMELLCLEKGAEPFAVDDPVFMNDERVLQNLYFLEKQYQPKFAYFKCVQTEITPEMRKIIADWLLEVCIFISIKLKCVCASLSGVSIKVYLVDKV